MAVRQAEENDGDDDLENIEPASVGVALLRGTSCGTVCDVLCCVVLGGVMCGDDVMMMW